MTVWHPLIQIWLGGKSETVFYKNEKDVIYNKDKRWEKSVTPTHSFSNPATPN